MKTIKVVSKQMDSKVSPCELQRLEDLSKRQVLAVPEDDQLIGFLAQLALDEAQQVLLMHTCAVVHVCVHLPPRQPASQPGAYG